jgi:two-component sensor histidine kinase
MRIKSLQGVKTTLISSHSLEDWGDLSLPSSLLYNLKHTYTYQNEDLSQKRWERDASHNSPMVYL